MERGSSQEESVTQESDVSLLRNVRRGYGSAASGLPEPSLLLLPCPAGSRALRLRQCVLLTLDPGQQ